MDKAEREDQQFCTSLIGEAGAENGLEAQGRPRVMASLMLQEGLRQ